MNGSGVSSHLVGELSGDLWPVRTLVAIVLAGGASILLLSPRGDRASLVAMLAMALANARRR